MGSGSFNFDCVTNKNLQMWANCYRSEVNGKQNITTNNGVECINRIIKQQLLVQKITAREDDFTKVLPKDFCFIGMTLKTLKLKAL